MRKLAFPVPRVSLSLILGGIADDVQRVGMSRISTIGEKWSNGWLYFFAVPAQYISAGHTADLERGAVREDDVRPDDEQTCQVDREEFGSC
ncbi:hypothetical protein ACG873_02325 [Mesorhizobium sp. AaZ16]|uniref:hypothetical protein n=1 Tax=Mesorhizobium sp. AaZ16 TaxID=3402289 RepID=UPI00374F97D0